MHYSQMLPKICRAAVTEKQLILIMDQSIDCSSNFSSKNGRQLCFHPVKYGDFSAFLLYITLN